MQRLEMTIGKGHGTPNSEEDDKTDKRSHINDLANQAEDAASKGER